MIRVFDKVFVSLRKHSLLLSCLLVINLIFLPLINSKRLRLTTDDSTLIISKVFAYRLNPESLNQNPFHYSTELRTQSYLTEYLFGIISSLLRLNLIEIERFIVFVSINALFLSFCFVISAYFKNYPIYALISFQILYFTDPILLLRPISPGFHLAVLFLTFGIIDRYFKKSSQHWFFRILPLYISFSFLAFSYIFYALLAFTVFCLVYVINAFSFSKFGARDFLNCCLFSLPILFFVTQQVLFPSVELNDLNFRWGVIDSHFPGAKKTFLFGILGLLLLLAHPATMARKLFFCIFGSSIALSNSNILTGRSMEFEAHFTPPVLVALTLLLPETIRLVAIGAKVSRNAVVSILCHSVPKQFTLIFFVLSMSIYLYSATNSHSKQQNPNITKLSILSLELPQINNEYGSVLSAPPLESEEIPLLMGRKLLFSRNGTTFFPMTNYEVLERRVLNDFLHGTSKEYGIDDLKSIFPRHFVNFSQKTRYERNIPLFRLNDRQEKLNNYYSKLIAYANAYSNSLSNNSILKQELKRYRVGFLLVESARKIYPNFPSCKEFTFDHKKFKLCN